MRTATATWQAQLIALAMGADSSEIRTLAEIRDEFDANLAAAPPKVDRAQGAVLRVLGVA